MGDREVCEEDVYVGEDDAESIVAEDIQPVRTLKTFELPSREEVAEHRVDHCPYRSWCDECRKGVGREDGHSNVESHSIAMISMDYRFNSRKRFLRTGRQDGTILRH